MDQNVNRSNFMKYISVSPSGQYVDIDTLFIKYVETFYIK